jgi:hypothetical protein
MLYLTCSRNFRAALALSATLALVIGPVVRSDALAAVNQRPVNPAVDDLNRQIADLDKKAHDLAFTPFDFCDPAIVKGRGDEFGEIEQRKFEARKKLGQVETVQQAARSAVATMADEGDLRTNSPMVDDYEAALKRGDPTTAQNLLKKMTPWDQEHVAELEHKPFLAVTILVPLADSGDVNAQARVAFLNTWGWDLGLFPIAGLPHDTALAFKYYRMAALNGDEASQYGVANAYACGLGTEKNLIRAYVWYSLALVQRLVSLHTDEAPQEIVPKRDFIAAEMSHDDVQRAKQLMIQCNKSRYKNCD